MRLVSDLKAPFLLSAFLASCPVLVHAAGSARIDFAYGNVAAVAASGEQRALAKGALVVTGDTIKTGPEGRAQLRFDDGAMVSLQPQSEFRLDNYQFNGKQDGTEKGFFSLLKGGLRTITGLIGKNNKDAFKVTTSVATIGIRGTEFTLTYVDGKSIALSTGEGAIQVCNGGGCAMLASGDSAVVRGTDRAMELSASRPQLPPAQPVESTVPEFSVAEERNPDATLSSPAPAPVAGLASGGAYRFAYAGVKGDNTAFGPNVSFDDVVASFDSSSALLSVQDVNGNTSKPGSVVGALSDDNVIGWGRWVGGVSKNVPLNTLHYVVGKTTPGNDLIALGNLSATYKVIGGTFPTSISGMVGTTSPSGTLSVNFSGGSPVSLNLALSLSLNGTSYTLNGSGTSLTPATFAFSSLSGTNVNFGSAQGFFAGPAASHAGVAYNFTSITSTNTSTSSTSVKTENISGTVAMKR